MTREDAITILKQPDRIGCNLIKANDEESTKYNQESIEALGMAIKALEQQPCEDTISRQAAIDALKGMAVPLYKDPACEDIWERDRTLDNAIDAIRGLPSAQPEQRWIPVSERMPEPRVDVWCNSDMGQMVGYYDEYAETWYGRDYLELIVTAWMPLPEPYRGERTEE